MQHINKIGFIEKVAVSSAHVVVVRYPDQRPTASGLNKHSLLAGCVSTQLQLKFHQRKEWIDQLNTKTLGRGGSVVNTL